MTAVDKTRQELIDKGQALVYSLVAKIGRSIPVRVDRDDLVAYGQLGLAEAARDFDPEQGVQFTTFAYYRVRGAIYDGLSKMSWTSRARYNRMRYDQMANEALLQAADSRESDSLEGEAGWLGGLTERLAVVYLAANRDDDQEPGITDSAFSPPKIVAFREVNQRLRDLIQELPTVERQLIMMTYFEGHTLQKAADRLGISKSWASRLHAKTLATLARQLRQLGVSE
jgi:RNA polymerase sigma factor for flagellar operon FliA